MIKRIASCLLALSFAVGVLRAADDKPFPDPIANPIEARIGVMAQPSEKHLRLDIGASVDVWEAFHTDTQGWLRLSADFMTYTRLRSDGNFKFPVETTDFYFGVGGGYAFAGSPLQLRLRIAHISSHMVDGLADTAGTIANPKPFVYSREFAEALLGVHVGSFRPYAGVTYVWARQPRSADPFIPQAGFDARFDLGAGFQIRAGYDWKLIGVNGTYQTAQAAQAGVFTDLWNGRGLLVSVYGYNGRSMHGMFFTETDSYLGLGFQVVW